MIKGKNNDREARASPVSAREMAEAALRRVGGLIESPDTDPRVLLQAAKLILSVAGQEDAEAESGGFELRFTGGADGDI